MELLKKYTKTSPTKLYTFERYWPNIQPTIRKLISSLPITNGEWQNLFCDIHMICSWDEGGSRKLLESLEKELMQSFIDEVRSSLMSIHADDGQQRLKEYNSCWIQFNQHCRTLPVAFQQLDLATRQHKPPILSPSCKNVKWSQFESTVVNLMISLWERHIVAPFSGLLQDSAMELIEAERNGHIIDSQIIVGLRESYVCIDRYNHFKSYQKLQRSSSLSENEPLSFYMDCFETVYLHAIEIFYTSKACDYFNKNGTLCYIQWALGKVKTEVLNAELYLGSASIIPIQRVNEICNKVLVANFAEDVLGECPQYIRANDSQNMKFIFGFLSGADSSFIERFLDIWRDHIFFSANFDCLIPSVPITNNDCENYVEKLLESYNTFDQIISQALENDTRAKKVLDQAYQAIVNTNHTYEDSANNSKDCTSKSPIVMKNNRELESRCSEFLASYCDLLLRRTAQSRKSTSKDLADRLHDALLVIKFIKDKSCFMRHYKIHLTRRLLLNTTIGIEEEEQFVRELKELSGMPSDYVNKLDRMFKDVKNSEAIQQQYSKAVISNLNITSLNNNNNNINHNNNIIQVLASRLDADLNLNPENNNMPNFLNGCDTVKIKILNPSAWPETVDKSPVCSTNEMSSILPNFEAFYRGQFEGRKLEWCHRISTGTLAFSTGHGKFDLEVTMAQLSILLPFNLKPNEPKTFDELAKESELSLTELKRNLWFLISNPRLKVQLLICEPKVNDMKELNNELNKFSVNHDFVLFKNGKAQHKGRASLIGRLQI